MLTCPRSTVRRAVVSTAGQCEATGGPGIEGYGIPRLRSSSFARTRGAGLPFPPRHRRSRENPTHDADGDELIASGPCGLPATGIRTTKPPKSHVRRQPATWLRATVSSTWRTRDDHLPGFQRSPSQVEDAVRPCRAWPTSPPSACPLERGEDVNAAIARGRRLGNASLSCAG